MSLSLGPIAGLGNLLIMLIDMMLLVVWEWLCPEDSIDIAPDFDSSQYRKQKLNLGDHSFNVAAAKKQEVIKTEINVGLLKTKE